jgi:catechol 2,3-dioxygenase-like lactoylglutathione lyase family enzyme
MLIAEGPKMLTLDHVVMPVRDAEATLKFYTEVLELPLVQAFSGDDWDGYPWLMMIFGLGGKQELVAVALRGAPAPDYRGVPVDARHYALAAASEADLDRWRARLREAGVSYWEEGHGEQSSIYFPDPDGVIFEITWPASRVPKIADPLAHEAVRRWVKATVPA